MEKRYIAIDWSEVYHDAIVSPGWGVGGWWDAACGAASLSVHDAAWLLDAPPPGRRYCKRCGRIAKGKEGG